jgi:phospholipid/cholesterol/gamma-HCH transport system substrate-binding protein
MRRALAVAAILLALALGVLACSGGSEPLRVSLTIGNANGLREGAEVKVSGATVGRVSRLGFGARDVVRVQLELDAERVRIGRGVSAAIRSANLLGQKFVDLDPGDATAPVAPGFEIPSSRVRTSVDLDQVLDILDADTRTRLGVLINESGMALTGRAADFNLLLASLPPDLEQTTELVDDLAADNRALRDLVVRGQALTSRMTRERIGLSNLVNRAGEAMHSVAARRAQLALSLERAPGALVKLQRFLARLEQTTVPLGPAARTLSAVAPSLTTTLAAIEPFRRSAAPALDEALAAVPALEQAAARVTPVVRQAGPAVGALRDLLVAAPPASAALDEGIDDTLGFVEGWARAIQLRDGVGHVFRGHLGLSPEALDSAVRQLLAQSAPARVRHPHRHRRPAAPRVPPAPGAPPAAGPEPPLEDTVDKVTSLVGIVTDQLRPVTVDLPAKPLLDLLLKP